MLRVTFVRLFFALPLLFGTPVKLLAGSDWIRPGTFIEWPRSLKDLDAEPGRALDLPELLLPGQILQTDFHTEQEWDRPGGDFAFVPGAPLLLPEEMRQDELHSDEAAMIEAVPPLGWPPLTVTQLDQVSRSNWQMLPPGLLYHSYLAGEKEPRTAAQWLFEKNRGLIWEAAVGGRWGLFRYGTPGTDADGFQFDVEGGALVRIDPQQHSDLEAADFRAGFVGTWRKGAWRWKAGYSHISCHLGDEFVIRNPTFPRVNYVRDSLLAAVMYDFTSQLQGYWEVAYAVGAEGGAEPVELQFGVQYSPAVETGFRGAPFAAVNGHLRQELRFGGSLNVEAGWAWRGGPSNNLFRAGFQHYSGNSMQWSFIHRYESLTGMGIWFDF